MKEPRVAGASPTTPVPYSRGSAGYQHEPDDTEQDVALRYALLPSGCVFNLLPLVLVCSVTELGFGFRDIVRQLSGTRAVAVRTFLDS